MYHILFGLKLHQYKQLLNQNKKLMRIHNWDILPTSNHSKYLDNLTRNGWAEKWEINYSKHDQEQNKN